MLAGSHSSGRLRPPDRRLLATAFFVGLAVALVAAGALLELRVGMLAALGTLGTLNALQTSRARTLDYVLDAGEDAAADPPPADDRQTGASIADDLAAMQKAVGDEPALEPLVAKYVGAARAALATSNRVSLDAKTEAASRDIARARRSSQRLESALLQRALEGNAALQRDVSQMYLAETALIAGVVLVLLSRSWEWLAIGRRSSGGRGEERDALAVVNRRLTLAIRSARVVAFGVDASGKVTWSNDAGSGLFFGLEIPFLLADLAPEAERARIQKFVTDAFRSGDLAEFEMKVERDDFDLRWIKVTLLPPGVEGEGERLGSAADVTGLKRREEGNVLLMRELSHRSKNLLAIVQAMARQTSLTAASPVEFYERFGARLRALAAGHDLLVKTVYANAELGELIRTQIGVLASLIGSRVFTEGPLVHLRPEATQTLGMALHELATNARIHGAMQNSLGQLDITWRTEGSGPNGRLIVDWVESKGPHVPPADRRGFGSTLIVENLPRSLHGVVTLDHFPEGTRCHMDLPFKYTLEKFAQDESDGERPEPTSG